MAPPLELSCATLEELYHSEGLSQAAIAARLGCSVATIGNRMRRCGIVVRDGRFKPRPPPQAMLTLLYSEEQLPLAVIAARLGVSIGTVHNWRRAYGIPARARRGKQRAARPPAEEAGP